jgi:hypothetical protein
MTRHHDIAARLGSLGDVRTNPDAYWTDGQMVATSEFERSPAGFMQPVYRPRIAIPKADVLPEERADYDRRFEQAIRAAFSRMTGEEFMVPVEPLDVARDKLRRRVTNANEVKVPQRWEMYRRMLRAGETLPPVVATRKLGPDGETRYHVLDGNHRYFAAQAEGVPFIRALEEAALSSEEALRIARGDLRGPTFSGLLTGGVR